jgi:anti-sigma factor RsiW
MNESLNLKLQAYLDGELTPAERQEVAAVLEQDANARALLAELGHTAAVVADFGRELKLPEASDFYWSKIRRGIEREARTRPETAGIGWIWARRWLFPAGAAAAVAFAVLLNRPDREAAGPSFTNNSEALAFTYQNYETGTTLVWLDYAAENDFSDLESADTLDL